MGVGADDDGNTQLPHFLDQPLARIEVAVAAFVDTAGIDLAEQAVFLDEPCSVSGLCPVNPRAVKP